MLQARQVYRLACSGSQRRVVLHTRNSRHQLFRPFVQWSHWFHIYIPAHISLRLFACERSKLSENARHKRSAVSTAFSSTIALYRTHSAIAQFKSSRILPFLSFCLQPSWCVHVILQLGLEQKHSEYKEAVIFVKTILWIQFWRDFFSSCWTFMLQLPLKWTQLFRSLVLHRTRNPWTNYHNYCKHGQVEHEAPLRFHGWFGAALGSSSIASARVLLWCVYWKLFILKTCWWLHD